MEFGAAVKAIKLLNTREPSWTYMANPPVQRPPPPKDTSHKRHYPSYENLPPASKRYNLQKGPDHEWQEQMFLLSNVHKGSKV